MIYDERIGAPLFDGCKHPGRLFEIFHDSLIEGIKINVMNETSCR